MTDDTIPRAMEELYALGIRPDWWKLEPQASTNAWRKIESVLTRNDPLCRGAGSPGLCMIRVPRKTRGRREDRVHAAPVVSCANFAWQ